MVHEILKSFIAFFSYRITISFILKLLRHNILAILPKFRDMFEIFESFKLLLRIRGSYNWAEKNLIFSYKKLDVGTKL